ncbi:MAG: hypothetical protein ACTSW1_09610 [Candidatus Hodarchaeales archaeon]
MSFTWDEMASNWILNDQEEFNQEECLAAFNIIDQYLGRDWLEEKYRYMKGPVTVIPILELGHILASLEKLQRFNNLVEKLKRHKELDLARLAAFYHDQGLEIQIEPEVMVDESIKVPDLLVKFGNTPIYFEAYAPRASKKHEKLENIATKIAQKGLEGIYDGLSYKVYLLKEPTKGEIERLINAIIKTPVSHEHEQYYNFQDIAKIHVKPREDLTSIDDGKYIADDIKRFYIVLGKIHGECIQKSIHVGMPFSDKRVDKILNKQYPQLSKKQCNVVAMELSGTSGELDFWADSLLSRFYGRNYTRIGAVILTLTLNDTSKNKTMTVYRVIKHPYPEKPLPDEFYEISGKLEDN